MAKLAKDDKEIESLKVRPHFFGGISQNLSFMVNQLNQRIS